MRIALTHNLRLSDDEDEAEFDTQATVDALASAIERLGHSVERIEVSGPASRTVTRLEAYGPDLIFNTAEGRRGRFREAFFPALFDELAMPYTGSDAYVLTLTLDKQLTKLVLAQHGVPTPRWQYVEDVSKLQVNALRYPVIVKPNFEGSSKGITQDSVVEDALRLHEVVGSALARYPAGVLVEEYITGRDVTVPYLEAAAPERGGVLQPVEYVIDEAIAGSRRYAIYDYDLKTKSDRAVSVRAPAKVKRIQAERIQQICQIVYRQLGVRDLGRVDIRLAEDGAAYFLEINALPSLEPGAGIYAAAALEGLHEDAVLGKVIESATRRFGIIDTRSRRGRPKRQDHLKVGFSFNVKRVTPDLAGELDDIDEMLAEIEAKHMDAAQSEAKGQLELFGALLSSFADVKSTPESHSISLEDGNTFEGTWEEIVDKMRDANCLSETPKPEQDAESFIRRRADAGLLRILR